MQCSWGKFQGTEHLVRDREILEIVSSQDRESPQYQNFRESPQYQIFCMRLSFI